MINEADKYDLVNPPAAAQGASRSHPASPACADSAASSTAAPSALTEEELERRFLPTGRQAGLPVPLTSTERQRIRESTSSGPTSGWWSRPTVCATTARRPSRRGTGCATRRTPPPGLTPLRFTHEQVRYEPRPRAPRAWRGRPPAGGAARSLRGDERAASRARIREVGPRDGFQNEPETISTADKVRLIDMLSATGLERIEVTSFVRPDVIPQLSDAAEVLAAVSAARASPSRS